jgi:NAD(P)-dependent dehydrogenase (short-subunit alcohol dehydrogenase family)
MGNEFSLKTAVVTGGGSGISLCVVKLLLKDDYNVSVLGLAPGSIAEIAKSNPGKVLFLPCDITDWAAVRDSFSSTQQKFGPISVVVNGADVYEPVQFRGGPLLITRSHTPSRVKILLTVNI